MGPDSSDHLFTLVEALTDTGKTGISSGNCDELLAGEEDRERSVASVEDQLRKEMTVYEVWAKYFCFWDIHSAIF